MSGGRIGGFLIILGGLIALSSLYAHRRTSVLLRLERRGRRVLSVALGAVVVLLLASRPLGGRVPDAILRPVTFVTATLALSIVVSVALLGLVDLGQLVITTARRLLVRPAPAAATPEPAGTSPAEVPVQATARAALPADAAVPAQATPAPAAPPADAAAPAQATAAKAAPGHDPSRRAFLADVAVGSALAVGTGSAFHGALFGRHDYRLEEVAVPIPGLSRRLDGFTMVQLSDIHLGLFIGEPEMRSAEALVRRARPDLVVLTGDLVDHDPRYLDRLGELTRRLAACAPRGVIAVPGNHDYYTGIGPTLDTLGRAGVRVLRNDGCVIGDDGGGFALLGVDDVWARRTRPAGGPDLQRAMAAVPADLPRVLLCHNPVFFPSAAGQVALQLSGHTHGAQVSLGALRPIDLFLPHGYVKGMYQRDGSRLYVNRGFGTAGPPARMGSPPEVTKVVLVAA